MRWREHSGPIIRAIDTKAGVVPAYLVDEAKPGDLDLSGMRMWHAKRGGYSYVISHNPDLAPGYVASCRSLQPDSNHIIGDEHTSRVHWLTDRSTGVATFAEAERACEAHARGRRDA